MFRLLKSVPVTTPALLLYCAEPKPLPSEAELETIIEISKEEAEEIATRHVAGTRYRYRDFEGTVKAVRFGDGRSKSKLETIRICEDGSGETRTITATFGIAIRDLRAWCAEHHGCRPTSIVLWFEEEEELLPPRPSSRESRPG